MPVEFRHVLQTRGYAKVSVLLEGKKSIMRWRVKESGICRGRQETMLKHSLVEVKLKRTKQSLKNNLFFYALISTLWSVGTRCGLFLSRRRRSIHYHATWQKEVRMEHHGHGKYGHYTNSLSNYSRLFEKMAAIASSPILIFIKFHLDRV